MKVLKREAIIKHYEDTKARLTKLSMRTADEVTRSCDAECAHAVSIFDRLGYLTVDKVGQAWTILDK